MRITLAVYTTAPPHIRASSQQLMGRCGGNLQGAGPRYTLYLGTGFASDVHFPSHGMHFSLSIFLRLRCRDQTWQIVWAGCRILLRHRSFRTFTCRGRLECGPVFLQLPYVSPD